MDGGQEENSKRPRVSVFSVILINFSRKASIYVVIYFTSFVLKKMGRNRIILYQKVKILALLGARFTYKNIQNKLGVLNDCITNISKKQQQYLPLKNRPGQSSKKSTTSKEDRHLIQLMKKRSLTISFQMEFIKWKDY